MKICITKDSAKLFSVYFLNKITELGQSRPNFVGLDVKDIVTELYNEAVKDFGKSFKGEPTELKELVLQHVILSARALHNYVGSFDVGFDNMDFTNEVSSLMKNLDKMIKANKKEQDLIKFMNRYVGRDKPVQNLITGTSTFNAISFEFSKTSNQDTVVNSTLSQRANVKNQSVITTTKTIHNIVKSSNSEKYSLKAMTYGEALKMGNTEIDKELTDDAVVLVLTDVNGNVVRFNEQGLAFSEGKIPLFYYGTSRIDFDKKLKTLPAIYAQNLNISIERATEKVEQELKEHFDFHNKIEKALKEGQQVFISIDLNRSSSGFVELRTDGKLTNLNTITNKDGVTLSIYKDKNVRFVTLAPENANSYKKVHGQYKKDVITPELFDALFSLVTGDYLHIEQPSGQPYKKVNDVRKNFLTFYFGDIFVDHVATSEFSTVLKFGKYAINYKKNEDGSIQFQNDFTLEQVKDLLKDHVYNSKTLIDNLSEPKDKSLIKDKADAKDYDYYYNDVTNSYTLVLPGMVNMGLNKTMELDTKFSIITGIKTVDGKNVLTTQQTTLRDLSFSVGAVSFIPNNNNELISNYPYLSFGNVVVPTENADESEEGFESLFQSISDKNRITGTNEQQQKALEWFKKHPLSKLIGFDIVDKVHSRGPAFVAEFLNNAITLYKGSELIDIYHESFHAFTHAILSKEEREKMYDVIKKQPGFFEVTVNGIKKSVRFNLATNLEIEEYLAEQFKAYSVKRNDTGKRPSVVTAFFEKLKNILNAIFGGMTIAEAYNLNRAARISRKTFNALFEGKIETANFHNTTHKALNKSNEIKADLSMEEVHLITDSMNSLFNEFVTYGINSANKFVINDMLELSTINEAEEPKRYAEVKNRLEERQETYRDKYTAYGVFAIQQNPVLLNNAMVYIKNRFIQQKAIYDKLLAEDPTNLTSQFIVKTLDKAIKNYGDEKSYKETVIADEGYKTLSALFLNNYTELDLGAVKNFDSNLFTNELLDRDEVLSEGDEVGLAAMWSGSNNDFSIQDLMDYHTKYLLSNVTEHERNGKGKPKFNMLNFRKLVPLENMISKTANLLTGCINRMEMYERLAKAAETDGEFKELLYKLGNPSAPGSRLSEQKQWIAFWQSMNKADIKLQEFVLSKKSSLNEDEDIVNSFAVYIGRTKSVSRVVARQWASNFNNLLQIGPYAKQDENSIPYFDLKQYLEDFGANKMVYSLETFQEGLPNYVEKVNSKNKQFYSMQRTKKAYADVHSFLSGLGIEIVDDWNVRLELFNGSDIVDSNSIGYLLEALNNRVKENGGKLYKFDDIFASFMYPENLETGVSYERQLNINNVKNTLQDLDARYSNENNSFMGTTAYGENKSEKALNSSLTVEINALNTANSYEELIAMPGMDKFDISENPWVAGNQQFVQMFNLDKSGSLYGKRNKAISFSIEDITGSKIVYESILEDEFGNKISSGEQDKGVSSLSSDEKTKVTTDFYSTILGGKQELPRMEAKATSLMVYGSQMVNNELRGGKTKKLIFDKSEVNEMFSENYSGLYLFNQFKGHLEAELIRMARLRTYEKLVKDSPEDYAIDFSYFENAKSFMMFDDLLSDSVKSKLEKIYSKLNGYTIEPLSIEKLVPKALRQEIEKSLVEYFENRAVSFENNHSDLFIDPTTLTEYKKINGEETKKDDILSDEDAKKIMMRTFITNNFLSNANNTSLFLGDLGLYNIQKGDFHKRIAGMISGGKIFALDDAWLNFVNSPSFNAYGFENKQNNGKNPRRYTGDIATAIITESEVSSKYLKEYEKIIGDKVGEYAKMKEADGQGWISFDMYRLLNLSCGEWSDSQEALYQKMLNGEIIENDTIKATFPVRKFQYYGGVKLGNKDLLSFPMASTAFHKYSLMPLVPQLIEGTKLQKLHEKMMREGVDYVIMPTGSKLSSLSRVKVVDDKLVPVLDDFYNVDKKRTITDNQPFVKNIINASHLKNQVYIAEGYKGKISFPTQMRKIVLHGLMDNGVPVDFKGTYAQWNALSEDKKLENDNYRWYRNYNDLMKKLHGVFKEELLADMSMVWDDQRKIYTGDTKAMASYIKEELRKNDFLPHELDAITDATGNLVDDLSFDLNSQKIESILTALVDKRLRKLKVNGEALVQVSGAMFERFQKPTKEQLKEFGSNELKFYSQNKDGSINPMEIKISLQGDFKNLIYLKHPDESNIAVYTKDGKVDWEASRIRLNEAIKDKEWQAKHSKMLRIAGVRIPTQGPNALDAATVAEFLPEWAGPIVILPSEIVAKTGADYDIDKMFFMFPSILRGENGPRLYKYKKLDIPIQDVERNINNYTERIESIENEIDDLYEEKSALYETARAISEEVKEEFQEQYALLKDLKKQNEDLRNEIYKILKSRFNESKRKLLVQQKNDLIAENTDAIKAIRKEIKQYETSLVKEDTGFNSEKSGMKLIQDKIDELNTEKDGLIKAKRESIIAIKESSTKGLENELLFLITEKILNSSNLKDLITPNGKDEAEAASKEVERLVKNKFDKKARVHSKESKGISPTRVLDYEFNLAKQQENSVGMESLGIAAVVSTFYALFTTYSSELNGMTPKEKAELDKALSTKDMKVLDKIPTSELKLDYNYTVDSEEGTKIVLGNRYSKDNALIADTISQLINGFVDVAKDPWVFNVQGTKENTPTLLFMLMAGVPLEQAVYLCSNPLVMEYNRIKKEMTGVYSFVNSDVNPIIEVNFDLADKALNQVLENNKDLYNKHFPNLSQVGINNSTKGNFSIDFLKGRIGSDEITKDDAIILAQYRHIEAMSNDLTLFQHAHKHDTKKVSSITDAESNINKADSYFSKRRIVPVEWRKRFKDNAIGVFDNNQFIIDMFKQFFKIKNNPIVNQLAIAFAKRPEVKKVIPFVDSARNAFKNDFISFLYQNAVYDPKGFSFIDTNEEVNNYELNKDYNLPVPVRINFAENKVSYSPDKVISAVYSDEQLGKIFISKTGEVDVTEYVKYVAMKQLLTVETFVGVTDEEIKKEYYFLDSVKSKRETLISRIALYELSTPGALFNSFTGAGSIISKFKLKYPELNQFSFMNDIKTDIDFEAFLNNIHLNKKTGLKTMQTYRENILALRSFGAPEVAEFFGKFNHYLMMQTGMNTSLKYYMGSLIDEKFVYNTIAGNEEFMNYITTTLNNLENKFIENEKKFTVTKKVKIDGVEQEIEEPMDLEFLSQFEDAIVGVISNGNWRTRSRGLNYTLNSKLSFSEGLEKTSNLTTLNNVVLASNIKYVDTAKYDFIFNPGLMLGSEEFPVTMESIREMFVHNEDKKVVFPHQKIIVPSYLNQKEFDELLLKYFGINNKGIIPQLLGKSKFGGSNLLTISSATIKPKYDWITDDYIASISSNAIAFPMQQAAKYNSKHKSYIDAIKSLNNSNLNEGYVPGSIVWIFGASSNKLAYADTTYEKYNKNLNNFFDKNYAKEISRAIEEGVTEFVVDTKGGIASIASNFLINKGFKRVTTYGPSFQKYYTFYKDSSKAVSPYFDVNQTQVDPYSLGINTYVEEIMDRMFSDISETDVYNNGYDMVREKTAEYFKQRPSDRIRFYTNVSVAIDMQLNIGSKPEHIFLEKFIYSEIFPALKARIENQKEQAQASNPFSVETEKLYAQLGNKTQSANIELPGKGDLKDVNYSPKTFWSEVVHEARAQFGDKLVIAYRGKKTQTFVQNYKGRLSGDPSAIIGNPFDFADEVGDRREQGITSSKKFMEWLLTGNNFGNNDATVEYRMAILEDIKNGKLKNRSIIYYAEKGYATHATVLDYLINEYQWNWDEVLGNLSNQTASDVNKTWYNKFWDYVNSGYYQAFIKDLEKTKSPEEIRNINNQIRDVYIQELKSNYPQLGAISVASDGSTVNVQNFDLLQDLEPTLERLMVGNHGVYLEFSEPQDKGTFIKRRMQYNEYNRNGIKLYDQFKTVNYADYRVGKWYADINEYDLASKLTIKANIPVSNAPTSQQLSLFDDVTDNAELWNEYKVLSKKSGNSETVTEKEFFQLTLEEQQELVNQIKNCL